MMPALAMSNAIRLIRACLLDGLARKAFLLIVRRISAETDKDAPMCVNNYLLYDGEFHPWYWNHRNTHQTQLLLHCMY